VLAAVKSYSVKNVGIGSLPKWAVRATSAFRLIATEDRTSRDVSNVPLTDISYAVAARS
jgi:hypothetical protein